MELMDKLTILTDAAKYDVACTSSGAQRGGKAGGIGSAVACGICHSFASDGRCISLLKVLMSNDCVYDCAYCVNRRSNGTPRASFTARELADLTMQFYRRNYIEGLFLSSAVVKNPDFTSEQMLRTLTILREEYRFGGYIHVKAIPGADPRLIEAAGLLADRMSVNIELPSQQSLRLLAPQKNRDGILKPMHQISQGIAERKSDLVRYRRAPRFVPAGQSTQMIIGATPDSDYQILSLTAGLYKKYALKRVFFSAYMPVVAGNNLPALGTRPPLLREHRLYQADWLLRFYRFDVSEIIDPKHPNLNPLIDPKCNWALHHPEHFPVEVNRAPYDLLLRVPGIGVRSAGRIMEARRVHSLDFDTLKKIGVVLKRAQYFITCRGRSALKAHYSTEGILRGLLSDRSLAMLPGQGEQLSLFAVGDEDLKRCIGP